MAKAQLKETWGYYCDTDKLVDDIMALLTKYHHKNTEEGVCSMLHTYFFNKQNLIDMFMKSENYIGNMRICIDAELERRTNNREVRDFCSSFPKNVDAKTVFLKYVDEDGKTLDDYTRIGVSGFKARELHYGNIAERLVTNKGHKDRFENDGATKASHLELRDFTNLISYFGMSASSTLETDIAEALTQHKMNATFVGGMKKSRAFNRLCSTYKVDKLPNYNRLFAQYADMVSGLKRKVKFYISLNPLDYFTMSFGNSWSSCHTIDKNNERGMPTGYHGMHCGGTMSYMLDHTSIITYVHNHATEDHEEGKIYRNMFHFDNGTLIQGRVYPQGNDGLTDLYKEFRRIMQTELAKLIGVEDNWIKRNCSCGNNTVSYGVHYPDYLNFDGCNVTYPSDMPEAAGHNVVIGHERICPNCGHEIDDEQDSGYLDHYDCSEYM